jgi:hypothetical protein
MKKLFPAALAIMFAATAAYAGDCCKEGAECCKQHKECCKHEKKAPKTTRS